MAGEIILGYDGLEGSKVALASATGVAAAYGCPLIIVFGYEPNPLGGEVKDLRDAVRAVGDKLLAEAEEAVHAINPNVTVIRELVGDRPAEALLRAGDEHDALAIVIGSADHGPLRGALLGSVTYQVVHRSTRPVLVVPVPDKD